MEIGILILGFAFLSSLFFNINSEPNLSDSERPEDDEGDLCDELLVDSLDEPDESNLECSDESDGCSKDVVPVSCLEDDRLTIVIPESGNGRIDASEEWGDAESFNIISNMNSFQLSWGTDDGRAWVRINSGEGQLYLDFSGCNEPPLNNITLTARSVDGGTESRAVSEYITDESTATFLFGSNNFIPQESNPRTYFLIGGDYDDTIIVHGPGTSAHVSFERGVLDSSGEWTSQIFGEVGNDSLSAIDGNFLIYSGSGDDVVELTESSAIVFGGSGNDTIIGQRYASFLSGDDGDDDLQGGEGNDTLIGGRGEDSLFGGDGSDLIDGYGIWTVDPADRVASLSSILESDHNEIYGGPGDDTIVATSGDSIFSDGGADNIFAYLQPGDPAIDLWDFDRSDSLVIDIVLREQFDADAMQDLISFRKSDAGLEVLYSGEPIVRLPSDCIIENMDVTVRFSAVGPGGEYLG